MLEWDLAYASLPNLREILRNSEQDETWNQ